MAERWLVKFAETLTRRLDDQERRLRGVERKPQLHRAALHDGSVDEYAGKQLVSSWGKQFDGTHTVGHFTGPTPPQPTTPDVEPGPLSLTVRWDGRFTNDDLSPMDLKHVEVVIDGKTRGEVTGELGSGLVVSPLPVQPHTVALVARTLSGKASGRSEVLTVTPLPNVQTINEDGSIASKIGEEEAFLTFGDASITPSGEAQFPALSVDSDPEFGGTPLLGGFKDFAPVSVESPAGHLDQMPWALLVNAERNVQGLDTYQRERELLEFEFEEVAGRAYRLTMEPISIYVDAGNAYGQIAFKYEHGGDRPTMNSPILRRSTVRNQTGDSAATMFEFGGSWIHQPGLTSGTRTMRILVTVSGIDGGARIFDSADGGYLRCYVEDAGMRVENSAVNRTGIRMLTDTSAPPPTEPTEKNYTRTWSAASTRSYRGNGSHYIFDESKLFQGGSPTAGDTRAMVMFPDLTADLSGATISSVEVYLYYDHWWYAAGGTANVGLHGYNNIQGSLGDGGVNNHVGSFHFNRNQGRWLKVPSQHWNGIKTGTFKGITIQGTGRDDYGYANAFGSRQPKIRIKYKK